MDFNFSKAKREKAKARICLCGASGGGKAQPVDTIIPTPNGNKRLGDIKVGDFVFDRLGKPTEVLAVFPQGHKEVFKVTLRDGRFTLCNDEHLWSYYTSRGNFLTKTLKEMVEEGIRRNDGGFRYKIPTNKSIQYEEKNLYLPPYVLGSFIGNGCCSEEALTISSNDIQQVEKVADLIDAIPIKQNEKNYSWKFERPNKYISEHNHREVKYYQSKEILGYLYGLKSSDKYISDEYKFSSIEQRYELLQGLFDTDGYISNDSPRFSVSYSTTSNRLAKDIQDILFSLGYSCSITVDNRKDRRNCYSVNVLISNSEKEKLFSLTRKKDRAIRAKEYNTDRNYDKISIINVEDLGYETEMVCIYVNNKEHLYLTNDYIVTHNTLSALYLAYGITGDWNKVAVVDSERGRALMYANRSDLGTGEFLHCDLEPPYTVERYVEAMKEASDIVGEDGVVIIDSGSHAWKGSGGVLDYKEQVSSQRGKTDFSAWNDAGKVQNNFIDTIMDLKSHVIVTLRSKSEYVQEKDPETGKSTVKKLGLAPVQRDDFEYEFMLVMDCDKETHNATIIKDNTFLDSEGWYGQITVDLGKKLKEWLNDGVEPEIITCECCGERIKTTTIGGKTLSAKEISEKSKNKYGKIMCMNCSIEASKKEKENNNNNNVENEENQTED